METGLRYQILQGRPNELVETAIFSKPDSIYGWQLTTRLNHQGISPTEMVYGLQSTFSPLSWVFLHGRVLHKIRWAEASSSTTAFFSARLQGHFPFFLGYFFEFGVYEKWHSVGWRSPVPVFFNASFSEWDFGFGLGMRVYLSPEWYWQASGTTIDSVEIFNLNHPYAELASLSQHENGDLKIYLRYQLLLGFGLPDAWVLGGTWKFLL